MASETDPDIPSTNEPSDQDDLGFWKRRKLEFRILILGRANAGKTTILERLAGASINEAEVKRDGMLLADHAIEGQSDRGMHNIDDEIRFHSLPGFVFHDSRGFEAGSLEELSTVQQFVVDHSSEVENLRKQLHAIWMCLPLDDSRELLKTEKEFFGSLKADTPLVVIFTKQDGAIGKATRSILDKLSSTDSTISRTMKKEARAKAEIQVGKHVKQCEEELQQLSRSNSCIVFLTTTDMHQPTAQSTEACMNLIEATEKSLTGPRIKTLLSVVWGRNLSRSGYWCFYWMLKGNNSQSSQLGSDAPNINYMIKMVVLYVIVSTSELIYTQGYRLNFWLLFCRDFWFFWVLLLFGSMPTPNI
ncbi:hypothetical protein GALMADRAFT_253411 [Galerina marginata CBS 339.88]|uniref:G domain-containing protein n=1 Tax=Galerina marginata (strain CBS 339.88) TaxID=685588 RepID=A0A067SVG9_GALM3|nr:hypothetical protein GALMADRAFT_253411 [Galerina marginata CBS 339.88]